MQQVPLQAAGIEERLQHLANRVDQSTLLGLLPPSPAPQAYASAWSEDRQWSYSTAGLTQISKTMLQLAQAHKRIANTQQNNHQTMLNVQQQEANAFKALAATTQQQMYDAMFTAVPRYNVKNK